MKPLVEAQPLLDNDERIIIEKYLNVPNKLQKMATLDYHNYMANHPDQIVKQHKWNQYTEQLYEEDDYKKFNTKQDVYRDLKKDLEIFENYGNFNESCLDSYKVAKVLE